MKYNIAGMKYLLPFILFLSLENVFSQAVNVPVKMAAYASAKNSDQLFVHTDKHIYTNNEQIWFSAWMLRCGNDSLPLHRFLSLVLVPADLRIPVKQQKFAMANGYSYGSMQLPDSIAPGEYKLVAGTNMLGPDSLPLALFTQEISVRSIRQSEFVAAATLLEDTTGRKDLLITVRNRINSQPVRDAELSLWCGNSKAINARTDKNGMYRQNLLVFTANPSSAIVITKIKYKGEVEYLQHKQPGAALERQLEMKFYPEGGNLVSNIPCNIGWESKSSQGEPVTTRAVLFEDQKPIDTIHTGERGLGRFIMVPHAGVTYRVVPITWPAEMSLKKDAYSLPTVLSKGMVLGIPKAIAGDSLRLNVFANGYSQVNMVVHNFRTVFNQQTLTVRPGGTRVLLLLEEVPKGLTAITLLDSNDHPLAERLFFAHYNNKAVCTITPDQQVYEKRQKVTISFQLNNNQQPAAGFAAVSCAQANRFENSKHQDIESFAYLHAELQDAPLYRTGQGFRDTGYLENVLLVRGWRRYAWPELLAKDHPLPVYYSLPVEGYVVPGEGKIKKPVTINLIGGENSVSFLTTDAKGHFQFSFDQLLVPQEKKLYLLAGNKLDRNKAVIQDPYLPLNKKLASLIPFNRIDADRYLQFAQDMKLEELKKVKQLAVVTVTQKRADGGALFGAANACGDYVCSYNKLNCFGHVGDAGNKLPEKGKVYRLNGGGTMVYSGCVLDENTGENGGIREYEGIKVGKEFYVDDYSEASGMPKYLSTIYWSPMLTFDKDGKASAHFYTSDITGRFRIVLNGVAGDNFFYGSSFIDVK